MRRMVAAAFSLTLIWSLLPSSVLAVNPVLRRTTVQSGLVNPWDVAFAPGGQMFVTERPGRVRVYRSGGPGAALLATTTIGRVHASGEAGVMGIAVDHQFSTNRFVYVCASRDFNGAWRNQVIRFHVRASWRLELDRYLVKSGMRAATIHNGCAVEEGPDHKIWVSMGDASQPYDAQDPDKLNGKILRINRNGSTPSDNPIWPGHSGPTKVYSIGHRNPQGIAFEPGTGRVYAVEHGPELNDEINWIRPGRNYGWPCVTGDDRPYSTCDRYNFTNPVWHTGNFTIANSGATFVRGSAWMGFNGDLFVSQLKEADLRRYAISSDGRTATHRSTHFNNTWGRLRAAVLGPGNNLWITTSNNTDDRVIRIRPAPPT